MNLEQDDRGSSILVVGDNRFLCEMICAWLRGAGYIAHGVQSERQCAAALEEGGFDLVLVDVDIPREQAISLLEAVRSKLGRGGLVLLTGAVRHDELLTWAGDAACVAMEKPYSFFALGLVIRAALARSRSDGQLSATSCTYRG